MASAWGLSFGGAWANSWGAAVPAVVLRPGGGPALGGSRRYKRKTIEELLADLIEDASNAPDLAAARKIARQDAEALALEALLADRIDELKVSIDAQIARQRSERRGDRLELYAAVAAQRAVARMIEEEEEALLLLY